MHKVGTEKPLCIHDLIKIAVVIKTNKMHFITTLM